MKNVIAFPTVLARNLANASGFVNQLARRTGLDQAAADHVIEQIRPLVEALSHTETLTLVMPDACDESLAYTLGKQLDVIVGERNRRILLERIEREILLYARHGAV